MLTPKEIAILRQTGAIANVPLVPVVIKTEKEVIVWNNDGEVLTKSLTKKE